jgi:hypothetical protein
MLTPGRKRVDELSSDLANVEKISDPDMDDGYMTERK